MVVLLPGTVVLVAVSVLGVLVVSGEHVVFVAVVRLVVASHVQDDNQA
ncbi:hypothetical protein [Kitasatospora sp. NBC_01302]|nr:hypothetical protein OG294_06400 [Kitasatospora sp. NBC_01302]